MIQERGRPDQDGRKKSDEVLSLAMVAAMARREGMRNFFSRSDYSR